MVAGLIILAIIGWGGFWFFVGRNNPNLKSVNNLIAAGKAIVDATGKVVSAVKAIKK